MSERRYAAPAREEFWRRLFEVLVRDADDLYTVVDAEARYLFVNEAAGALHGRSPDACIGLSAFDVVHPEDRERTRRAFFEWVRAAPGRPLRFENRLLHADGGVREMAWTIYPYAEDGGLVGFASFARDVGTERDAERRLARREAEHRELLASMLDPVVAIDEQGVVQRASRSVEKVFGWRPDELIGKNVSVLMPEPHHSQHDFYLERYRLTGETSILGNTREFQVVRRDGERIDVELSVARVDAAAGEAPLFIGSFRNITERKRALLAETSMLRALAAVGEQTAMLVHELKNPLTAVNLALRAVAQKLGADEREVLEDLVASMKRLERRLRDTLSFARALEPVLRPCEPAALFDDALSGLRPVLARLDTEVVCDVDDGVPAVRVDPRLMEHVLSNLLMNAADAVGEGGRVRLAASIAGPGRVALLVEDDGPGIPESVRASLFDPFVTTKDDGTGLGLSICRRIVEELGGALEALERSSLGGAAFRIELPASPSRETNP